jgi:hypothetical protein
MANQQKAEDVVMSILPPFIQSFLKVEVKLLDGKKRQIKELVTWDVRGYKTETKDPKDNENYDLWNDKKSGQWCIKHRAVEKLADVMGIEIVPESVKGHSQPTVDNRYQHVFTITVVDMEGDKMTYVGEANNAGGGMVQNNYNAYPASMAFKRAFDRCVMKLIIKKARKSYLLANNIQAIAEDQDIHVDIESEDFQKPQNEEAEANNVPTLTTEEEGQMKPYYDKIISVDTSKPKSKSAGAVAMLEGRLATHESSLNELLEWGKGKGGLNPKQVDVLEKMVGEKLAEIKKLQKAYGFGPKTKSAKKGPVVA